MELKEIFDGKMRVIEEDVKTGIMKIQFPFCVCDTKNSNGRTYGLPLMERETKKMNKSIDEGNSVYGFSGHPRDAHGDLENVSHLIEKLSITKGICWGVAAVLSESKPGKMLKTILRAGGKVGSSMRGTGTVTNGVVNTDYSLLGVDWVINPSFGKDVKFDQSAIIEQQKEVDQLTLKRFYQEATDSGYRGSFSDFRKLREERKNLSEAEKKAQAYIDDEAGKAGKF